MNDNNVNQHCEDEDKKGEDCEREQITRKVIEKNHSSPPTSHYKRFGCTYSGCKKTYTTVGNLKTHLKTHSGEYTFRCNFEGCSKTFQSSYNLKIHLRVHTGEKPYYCKEKGCEKVFSSSYRMKVHQRVHSGKTFDCKFESCEKVFTTMKDLRRHERTHTGERPFQCKVEGCGSAFTVSHHLKDHLRTHAGERPFICNETGCVKAFNTSSQLKMHLKTHSREKSQFFETETLDYSVHKTTSETEVGNKSYLPLEKRITESKPVRETDKTAITQQEDTNNSESNTDVDSKAGSSPIEVVRTSLKSNKQTLPASQSCNSIELSKDLFFAGIGTSDNECCKDLEANHTNMEATPEQRLPNILGICSLSSSNQNSKPYSWQPVDPYEDCIVPSTATVLNPTKTFPQPLPTTLFPDCSNSSATPQSEVVHPVSDLSSSGNVIFPKSVLPKVNTAQTFSVNRSSLFLPALPRPVYPGCYPFLPFPNLFTPPLLSRLPTPIQQSPESSIVVRDNTLVVVSGAEEFPLTSADNSVICLE